MKQDHVAKLVPSELNEALIQYTKAAVKRFNDLLSARVIANSDLYKQSYEYRTLVPLVFFVPARNLV